MKPLVNINKNAPVVAPTPKKPLKKGGGAQAMMLKKKLIA